jgi:hypothetical protein
LAQCCGNGTCETGEDCITCAADCPSGAGGSPGVCGNGTCEPTFGEDCLSCASDCNGKTGGKPSRRFCCGDGDGTNPVDCTDARCTSDGYQCGTVSGGGTCCGDFACEGDEDCATCAVDCQMSTTEVNYCADGLDNDCDGPADCNDSDCTGDPACDTPTCGAKGDACSTDTDCCSGNCLPAGKCK